MLFIRKMPSNYRLSSNYSKALAIQIDLFIPKLYFILLIRTQTKLLADVNCLNKVIWKLASNDGSLCRISFLNI